MEGDRETDELRKKIGQLFIVGFTGLTVSNELEILIRAPYYVGSVVLFDRNISSANQLITLTDELQQLARDAGHNRPLLIAIGQENGLVSGIKPPVVAQLPGAMAIAATGSASDALSVSRATGEMLDAMGINMNFAPCCDINSEPSNSVIGVRSPGDDPYLVGRFSSEFAQGLREKNIIPCVKHFPGHADSKVFSDTGVPVVNKSREELDACELIPFRRVTAENLEAVMISHVAFPSLDGSKPMSVSKQCVHLLRDVLQYEGVCITDCLEKGIISSRYRTEEAAVMAINAGIDCVMISHTFKEQTSSYMAVYNSIRDEKIPIDRISQSVNRVKKLKKKIISWRSVSRPRSSRKIRALNHKHRGLATEVYRHSATLVRDKNNLIPVGVFDMVAYVYPLERYTHARANESTGHSSHLTCIPGELFEVLQTYCRDLTECPIHEGFEVDCDDAAWLNIRHADAVILVTRNAAKSPHQQRLAQAVAQNTSKLITISIGDPYDLLESPEIATNIAIYEPNRRTFITAAQIMFGEAKPRGNLPVFKKRPNFPVVPFDSINDMPRVIKLWNKVLPQYPVPSAILSDLFTRHNARHFTMHCKEEVIGFVATYANEDRPTTFISVLLVEPAYQSQGIGSALLEHARWYLRNTYSTRDVTIGSSFPRFWPGVPGDLHYNALEFFIRRGFLPDAPPIAKDYTVDLRDYEPPGRIMESAASLGYTFVPLREDLYRECIDKQKELFGDNLVWVDAYEALAREEKYSHAMVAFNESGKQVGWAIMQELGVGISKGLACQHIFGDKSGHIGCVGVDPASRKKGVGIALVCHAALDLKSRGMEVGFIDWVTIERWYEKAGFKIWREYLPMTLTEMD